MRPVDHPGVGVGHKVEVHGIHLVDLHHLHHRTPVFSRDAVTGIPPHSLLVTTQTSPFCHGSQQLLCARPASHPGIQVRLG